MRTCNLGETIVIIVWWCVLQTGVELELVDSMPLLEWFANNYKVFGATLEIITDRSQEGAQFVKGFGGIGGREKKCFINSMILPSAVHLDPRSWWSFVLVSWGPDGLFHSRKGGGLMATVAWKGGYWLSMSMVFVVKDGRLRSTMIWIKTFIEGPSRALRHHFCCAL